MNKNVIYLCGGIILGTVFGIFVGHAISSNKVKEEKKPESSAPIADHPDAVTMDEYKKIVTQEEYEASKMPAKEAQVADDSPIAKKNSEVKMIEFISKEDYNEPDECMPIEIFYFTDVERFVTEDGAEVGDLAEVADNLLDKIHFTSSPRQTEVYIRNMILEEKYHIQKLLDEEGEYVTYTDWMETQ